MTMGLAILHPMMYSTLICLLPAKMLVQFGDPQMEHCRELMANLYIADHFRSLLVLRNLIYMTMMYPRVGLQYQLIHRQHVQPAIKQSMQGRTGFYIVLELKKP